MLDHLDLHLDEKARLSHCIEVECHKILTEKSEEQFESSQEELQQAFANICKDRQPDAAEIVRSAFDIARNGIENV